MTSQTGRPEMSADDLAAAAGRSTTSFLIVPRTNAILCEALSHLLRSACGPDACQMATGDVHQIRWSIASSTQSVCVLDNPSEALCSTLSDVQNCPPLVILVPSDVRPLRLRAMMKLGPAALVSYEASLGELRRAIDAASRGELYAGESMRGMVSLDAGRRRLVATVQSPLDQLTARQLEVAKWLTDGYTIAEVAEIMELAEKTVESHRYRIMGRLNLSSRVELTRLLVQEGVVSRNYHNRADRGRHLPTKPQEAAASSAAATASTALQ